MFNYITGILGLALTTCSLSAQEQRNQRAVRGEVETKPTNCERHIVVLEGAHHEAGDDGLARLGNGENSRSINQHRLHSARAYLTDYLAARLPGSVVIAEGERVNGYGRIEIYIKGRLYSALAVKPNADLSVGSCEPKELDDPRQRELRKSCTHGLIKLKRLDMSDESFEGGGDLLLLAALKESPGFDG